MVFKMEPRQWNEAVKNLRNNLAKFQGMQEKVLKTLKFSFDALPNDTHKKCFLYCSLFPEDSKIEKYDLIDLWIGEGYFDECDNIQDARYCCEDVLHKLTTNCLLEEVPYDRIIMDFGKRFSYEVYKMHDLVREMALWVAREQYQRKLLVLEDDEGTIGLHELKRWEDAEMISLMHEGTVIQELLMMPLPYCLNLGTLLLRNTKLIRFPSGFFSSMPSLKVLDLRHNECLRELAGDIGQLTKLEYLDIQYTRIRELPEEFKKLVNLKYLFLHEMFDLYGVIVSSIIPSLRVLDTTHIGVKHQEFYGWKLQKHFEHVIIYGCPDLEEISICSSKENEEEEEVKIGGSIMLGTKNCFHNLRRVGLVTCPKVLHLTSLIYGAPNLENLVLINCESMTELVRMVDVSESQAVNTVIFSCLKVLFVMDVPLLKSICGFPIPFPSLRWMFCLSCPNLRKLPFCVDGNHQQQFNKLEKIEGESEWWKGLEWDDNVVTQQLLAPKFVSFMSL